MSTQPPPLPSTEEMAEQVFSFGHVLELRVMAAAWNWPIVGRTLARSLLSLVEIEARILDDAFTSALTSEDVTEAEKDALAQRLPPMKAARERLVDEIASLEESRYGFSALDLRRVERLNELAVQMDSPVRWKLQIVPGALELPLAAQWSVQGEEDVHGVLALGAVVRGQTPHFDIVCRQSAAGLNRVALEYDLPVVNGVLTLQSAEQAEERIDRAADWMKTLLLMCLRAPQHRRSTEDLGSERRHRMLWGPGGASYVDY